MTDAAVLNRQRRGLLAVLLSLATAAWIVVVWQAGEMDSDDMGLTMGMNALLFLAVWVAMMMAMMFPASAPMVLAFDHVQTSRRATGTAIPTSLFVASYLAVWALVGVLAYVIARIADSLASDSMFLMDNGGRFGGALLIAAGVYQLTPLKNVCLSKCRTPASFIMTSWRDGAAGAVRMGVTHAAYCTGCCWLLFAVLFPLGMMNIAVLALVTAVIFAEKTLPVGEVLARTVAVALIGYGAAVVISPSLLPGMM
jgi:predicted metal-binding membrane protein